MQEINVKEDDEPINIFSTVSNAMLSLCSKWISFVNKINL